MCVIMLIIVIKKVDTREKHLRSIGKRMPRRTADVQTGRDQFVFFLFDRPQRKEGRVGTQQNIIFYCVLPSNFL